MFFFFFFQAEDGIRDLYVTGVQTCALPICKRYPGQAKKVMMGLWGMGQLSLTKILVVVDHNINDNNINEVIWAITTNIGRASCRDRVSISVVAVELKKKNKEIYKKNNTNKK